MDINLIKTDSKKFVENVISSWKEKTEKAAEYRKEYYDHDRELRETQVGKTQKDKNVNGKIVYPVRTIASFQKKIVSTAAAFEVGSPVTLIPSDPENKLAKAVFNAWKSNRIDSKLQKLITNKKIETQSAIHFFISDITDNSSLFAKLLSKIGLSSVKKEIKSEVLEPKNGTMYPAFDGTGNMIAFLWEYETTVGDKKVKRTQIWDKTNVYVIEGEGSENKITPVLHGFDRIPIVYVEQDKPEWYDVRELIDRYETVISKLGDSNDYSAYPILQIFGEIKNLPEKSDNGKILRHPINLSPDGKEIRGDAKFLTADNSTESITLEINELKNNIYTLSHTPQLSSDKLTGLGSLSGVALELMFLDAKIKASNNEGENRTAIERILNILISGLVTTVNASLKSTSNDLYFDVEFNSILPNDFDKLVETLSTGVQANIVSRKTAVKALGVAADVDAELDDINADIQSTSSTTPPNNGNEIG